MDRRRYTIKELPPELRPRERLLAEGPDALSAAELLGIMLGIGSKEQTAVELGQQVISESGGSSGYTRLRRKTETTKQSAVGFRALISAGDAECLEFTKA